MNERLKQLRLQALNVMAFEHENDPEIVELRKQIAELHASIAEPLKEINTKIENYLEQYIPSRLQYREEKQQEKI